MAHPKTLQVFLMDGAPTGRLKCTLDNWTGLVYVVPRTSLNADGHPEACLLYTSPSPRDRG